MMKANGIVFPWCEALIHGITHVVKRKKHYIIHYVDGTKEKIFFSEDIKFDNDTNIYKLINILKTEGKNE